MVYIYCRSINTHENYNAVVVKGADAQENYEFLTNYPSTGNFHYPVKHILSGRSTHSEGGVTFSNTAYGVYQLDYDQSNFIIYVNGTNTETDAGNSTQILEYFDVDYNPEQGVNYYRLKQTDFDGKYSFSNIVSVNYNNTAEGDLNLFPNPIEAGSILNILFEDINGGEVLVVLRDITGREFYSKIFINIEKAYLKKTRN
jgi:hypothetical protein